MENEIVDAIFSPILVAPAEAAAGTSWYEVLATFIASITGSLAWPVVLVILVFMFKEHIIKALKNLKSFKWGDAEAIFDTVKAATEEAKAIDPVDTDVANANNEEFNALLEAAKHSPTGAIVDAWKMIDSLARQVVDNEMVRNKGVAAGVNAGRLAERPVSAMTTFRILANSNLLPGAELKILDYLREVRNRAAHVSDADIDVRTAEQYVRLADKLMDALRQVLNQQQAQDMYKPL
jgi:hypothetical protein